MTSAQLTAIQPRSTPSRAGTVLFVQAGPRQRLPVSEQIARCGAPAIEAQDVAEALRLLGTTRVALCVVDLTQDRAVLTAIRLIRARYPTVPIAAVADAANPVIAAEAMHAGVSDVLPWPFDERQFGMLLAHARDCAVADTVGPDPRAAQEAGLFVQSAAMRAVLEQVTTAAARRQHVCLTGEASTGRSLVARELHRLAGGTPDQFVRVDCATDAPADLERRLFGAGAERRESASGSAGAAVERLTRDSAVVAADGGTLFLANVTEAPARVQARLARLLRDREATLDGRSLLALDVRVIVATEPDLDLLVADGRLRADLAARVAQVRIDVPPLRRRAEDIPLLVVHLIVRACDGDGVPQKHFSRSALALLAALPWHGNGRELVALIEGLVRSVRRRVIQLEDVLAHAALDGFTARIDVGGSLREAKVRFERECISAVLMRHHGRVGEAAKALGIQRTNLYRKLRQLNVSRALLSARR
jgi:DNA-binding NtrC family response regulator